MSLEERWTYGELDDRVAAAADRLRHVGVESGMRVAVSASRDPDTVVVLWALWRIGAVVTPLNLRLPPEPAIRGAAGVGASVCITDDDAVADAGRGVVSLHGLHEIVDPSPPDATDERPVAMDPERPATLVFTSGSTGTPKAALHTWRNHVASAVGANANIPVTPGDRWVLSLPLYHVGGLAILMRCALGGAAVVVPSTDASLADALATTSATHVSLVATQLRRLLHAGTERPASMAAMLVGGGPVPGALVEAAHDRGWPTHTTYGCTEMASQVTTTPPGASIDTLKTAGRVLPHRRLRIAEDGEILVAGATLFEGYVTGSAVHDPRTDDGWFPTGDLGRLDGWGRLHVRGRKDHMFISGGENIQPEDVERVLEDQDGVARAVVVPVSDEEFGHRPVAFVQMATADVPSDRLASGLASELPPYEIPVAFLPMPGEGTDGIKIDRRSLRRHAQAEIHGSPNRSP